MTIPGEWPLGDYRLLLRIDELILAEAALVVGTKVDIGRQRAMERGLDLCDQMRLALDDDRSSDAVKISRRAAATFESAGEFAVAADVLFDAGAGVWGSENWLDAFSNFRRAASLYEKTGNDRCVRLVSDFVGSLEFGNPSDFIEVPSVQWKTSLGDAVSAFTSPIRKWFAVKGRRSSDDWAEYLARGRTSADMTVVKGEFQTASGRVWSSWATTGKKRASKKSGRAQESAGGRGLDAIKIGSVVTVHEFAHHGKLATFHARNGVVVKRGFRRGELELTLRTLAGEPKRRSEVAIVKAQAGAKAPRVVVVKRSPHAAVGQRLFWHGDPGAKHPRRST
jgi:hypothetical protein